MWYVFGNVFVTICAMFALAGISYLAGYFGYGYICKWRGWMAWRHYSRHLRELHRKLHKDYDWQIADDLKKYPHGWKFVPRRRGNKK